jgi:hypothetical protein
MKSVSKWLPNTDAAFKCEIKGNKLLNEPLLLMNIAVPSKQELKHVKDDQHFALLRNNTD